MLLAYPCSGWTEDFHVAAGDIAGLSTAINSANATGEPDTIYLEAGTYTISENNPESFQTYFQVVSPVAILGAGSAQTVIERKDAFAFQFFLVNASGELTLRDLTITGGDGGQSCGGAIRLEGGKLTIEHSTISNNYSGFGGGAICNNGGTLTIDHSVFTGNTSKSWGGAIDNTNDAVATIKSSTFKNNQGGSGGALYNDRSDLLVTNSIIIANSSTGRGGGVSSGASGNSSSTTIDVTGTTISNNTAEYDGGGLNLHSSNSTIRNSTISNNIAGRDGGGVWNGFGSKLISNTTISGNRANGYGGGVVKVDSSGSLRLNNVTAAFNVADDDGDGAGLGGGIANGPSGNTFVSNSIIAGNKVSGVASECSGGLQSGGFNLFQVLSPDCVVTDHENIIGEDPLLGPLTNNGGLTDTHALAPGSPAIDAGSTGMGVCEDIDQRGVPRNCDIGAFELGELPPNPDFQINAGLNDAWYNPETSGQGFLITVFPVISQMFIAWFTFDTERPPASVPALLGEAGHRWLTAQGPFADNQASLDVFRTAGGIFDLPIPRPNSTQDGSIQVEFSSCNRGTISYDLPSIDRRGVIPIERITLGNVRLCEELEAQMHEEQ